MAVPLRNHWLPVAALEVSESPEDVITGVAGTGSTVTVIESVAEHGPFVIVTMYVVVDAGVTTGFGRLENSPGGFDVQA